MSEKTEQEPKKAKKPALSVVERDTLNMMLERVNDEYAVILRGSQVLIMRHWIGEDGNSKLIFLNRRDFLLLQENLKLYKEGEKPVSIGQAWLSWGKRAGYEEVYFEPCGKEYHRRYNLWRGFAVEPKKGAGKFDILLDHIRTNICQSNEEQFAWVVAWLAGLFQKPARKLGTALVLRGAMGIGKGAFANHIGRLLGLHYMAITQASQLTGKFNSHMSDKLLMFVDEGWWSDERNGAGILRALITEPEVTIEMKNRDAVSIRNYTRFIIAANADWVVPLGMGDERRFVILDVGDTVRGNKPYFKAMEKELLDGGYQAFLDYLLNYQYDESLPSTVIKTEALCENKIYSMPPEWTWWMECLTREKVGDFQLGDDNSNDVPTDRFFQHYLEWCEKMRHRPVSYNVFPKKLKPMVELQKMQKRGIDGKREYYYLLKNLSDLRLGFENAIGHTINWLEA